MSAKPILQEKIPQRFEGRNIRTPKRSNATDDVYIFQCEITREAWEALETVPKTALLEGVIWFHFGDPEKEQDAPAVKPKREKKEKLGTDENGRYWQKMEHPGCYYAVPGLAETLDCEMSESAVNEAIRKTFNVETRRQISPEALEGWASTLGLDNLITVSRTAQVAAARKAKPAVGAAQEAEG